MVTVSPIPKSNAMNSPFLYPLPMLSGTIMKTSGRVHGSTIIERPATYAIVIHERYDVCSFPSIIDDVPIEKIAPTKISENNPKDTNTSDFFATCCDTCFYVLDGYLMIRLYNCKVLFFNIDEIMT